jgi:hypothetical protein
MEDLLDLYERPHNADEPVVCLDERPVQLLDNVRVGRPASPSKIARHDYEYRRRGTSNLFCAVEPKAGRHLVRATPNRKAPAFAQMMRTIAQAYPTAKTIHLVIDNLSTHTEWSLLRTFGEDYGTNLWNRFRVHYTPKHGSWLNQAEIQISLVSRQALGRSRVATIDDLRRRTSAWARRANRLRTKIRWTFTTERAREKFKYLPTQLD